MDPVTQGALGAACSQALLHPYDKRNAWIAGALGGMAADLDVLIYSTQDPMLSWLYHRHFTHALTFILPGGFLVALALLAFKRFRPHWWMTWLSATIGYATHGLLDACTSYGVVLYWPFSMQRVSWDLISMIDLFFTFPLVLGLAWTVIFDDRKGVLFGLLAAALFLGFNGLQHSRALETLIDYGHQHYQGIEKPRVFPQLTSSTHWRAVAYVQDQLMIADVETPLFHKSQVHLRACFPIFQWSNLPSEVSTAGQQRRDFEIFHWFTDGYVIVASHNPFILVDARYLWGHNPMMALWGIQLNSHQKHVSQVRMLPLEEGVEQNDHCNIGNR